MNSTIKNRRNEQVWTEIKNGEPFIWTEKCKGELVEFLEYAINGTLRNYGYDHIIYGYKTGVEEPFHVATCRGKEFALDCVMMFNNAGLTCAVYPKTKYDDLWD